MSFGPVTRRDWQPGDRAAVAELIAAVLAEYGLGWEPQGADRDVLAVEECYLDRGGCFWLLEQDGVLVGTGAWMPLDLPGVVEIRKMYLLPGVRGQGLGRWLLAELESSARAAGYRQARVETASVLREAVRLYESAGYRPLPEVETARCDRAYFRDL